MLVYRCVYRCDCCQRLWMSWSYSIEETCLCPRMWTHWNWSLAGDSGPLEGRAWLESTAGAPLGASGLRPNNNNNTYQNLKDTCVAVIWQIHLPVNPVQYSSGCQMINVHVTKLQKITKLSKEDWIWS